MPHPERSCEKGGNAMEKRYDYLVVGAGLYGSVFAREAKKSGKKVLVLLQKIR